MLQEIEHDLGCYDMRKASATTTYANLADVVRMILAAPKEDVAKIIRCKDCLYRSQYTNENGMYKCGGIEAGEESPLVSPDFFCAFGRKR